MRTTLPNKNDWEKLSRLLTQTLIILTHCLVKQSLVNKAFEKLHNSNMTQKLSFSTFVSFLALNKTIKNVVLDQDIRLDTKLNKN